MIQRNTKHSSELCLSSIHSQWATLFDFMWWCVFHKLSELFKFAMDTFSIYYQSILFDWQQPEQSANVKSLIWATKHLQFLIVCVLNRIYVLYECYINNIVFKLKIQCPTENLFHQLSWYTILVQFLKRSKWRFVLKLLFNV